MAALTDNLQQFMSVGTKVMIFTERVHLEPLRLLSAIRGWRPGSHVLMDRPKSDRGSYAITKAGDTCIVRYVLDGRALAFDSTIVEWDTHRVLPCLRLAWPQEIQCVQFRRHERIQCRIPCQIFPGSGGPRDGELRDLSIGGCGITVAQGGRIDEEIELSFTLPDGTRNELVKAFVRSERITGDERLLGCQFSEDDEQVANDIAFYVSSTLERRAGEQIFPESSQRVLIIDSDADTVQFLRQRFDNNNFDVVVADNVVDCMYRLRMSHPTSMLIRQDLTGLDGVQICKLIKRHADFAKLPVFIYGGNDPGIEARARQAGAAGYYESARMAAPEEVGCSESAAESS